MASKLTLSQRKEAAEWLLKPLLLEARQGFLNKAVAGGLEAWLPRVEKNLVDQAGFSVDEAGKLLAPLAEYPGLDAVQRKARVAKVRKALAECLQPETKSVSKPATKPEPETAHPKPAPKSSAPKAPAPARATGPFRGDMEVQYIHGVGPQRGKLLARLGVNTVDDLLRHFPRDWQDRRQFARVHELAAGAEVTLMGTVKARSTFRLRRGLTLTKILIDDGTGILAGTWFNQPYMRDRFTEGQRVVFYGKAEFYRGWQMANPDFELMENAEEDFIHLGRIVPVYPATERLSQRVLRSVMYETLQHAPDALPDILPPALTRRHAFAPLAQSLRQIHFPENLETLEQAKRRLVFEELFLQQVAVGRLRNRYQEEEGRALKVQGETARAFLKALPFKLTRAQEVACRHIDQDLAQAHPMHRLLQGDVGSGKTLVAALALCAAVDSGCQGALMAPTEVLAAQHFFTLSRLFEPLGVSVELFTSAASAKDRRERNARLVSGEIQIAVGTHALTQDQTLFHELGLAVIDEQHRFGVEQRAQLAAKGCRPHVLVMTATPIPRTLALTVYGDLDVTVLDELPPGRTPVQTQWLGRSQARRAYDQIAREIQAGRQAYIVFPLIEESEKLDLKSLVKEYDRISKHVFPDFKVGLLHGRLGNEEKASVMAAFKAGEIQVLASTTVIEVGVDVPNASVMVIEDADRFGLAQLHQLRGRVGRGAHLSFCYVIADPKTEEGKSRMDIIARVRDGFLLAEEDLALRGPGEFLGLRQHGLPDLKLANLARDAAWIEPARQAAREILNADPQLALPEHAALKTVYEKHYAEAEKRAMAG